jgi:hypothetical protein
MESLHERLEPACGRQVVLDIILITNVKGFTQGELVAARIREWSPLLRHPAWIDTTLEIYF